MAPKEELFEMEMDPTNENAQARAIQVNKVSFYDQITVASKIQSTMFNSSPHKLTALSEVPN